MPGARSWTTDDPTTARTPDRDSASGLSIRVIGEGIFGSHPLPASGRVVIGRAPDADVRVVEPTISRHHAALHVGSSLQIEDLGSANGTHVGERRIAPGELVTIATGQLIELGSITVVVQPGGASERPRRLWPHDYFMIRLGEECERGTQPRAPFALVCLRVEGNLDVSGFEASLAGVVRPYDVVGACAAAEYELLLLNTEADGARQAVRMIAEAIAARGAQLKSGVACCPADGTTAPALLEKALSALREEPLPPSSVKVAPAPHGAMAQLYRVVDRIAAGTISVLLLGETGVGKEVLAETIHRRSPRASMPLLRLNCAALSGTLVESELFGHERGAFTGAAASKLGLLETAEGGTVFLDEVGELPLTLQVKLLRVLEERSVWRVGALKPRAIDVRFIAATNRDLEAEIAAGHFRQDLYFRLNGMTLRIPPLRERTGEIAALAEQFAAEASQRAERATPPAISVAALGYLQRYAWPGNIRELRNVIEQAVLLGLDDLEILPGHLPLETMVPASRPPLTPSPPPPQEAAVASFAAPSDADPYATAPRGLLRGEIETLERQQILDALARCGGNQTQAAKLLGIARGTLVSRLNDYGVRRPRKRS
jgi:two-component system, NtrC family, response regulator AtoC